MKLLNFSYTDIDSLVEFIESNSIPNSNSVLIQLFYSNTDINKIYSIRESLISILPNASLMVTSTAGIISDGLIKDNEIIASFSIFKNSTTKSISYCSLNIDEILNNLANGFITEKTKLLLVYVNTFLFDSECLLKKITQRFPKIVIAGGNAGDDNKFEKCDIFSYSCKSCDVVFAAIDSDTLHVETKFLFNWHTIGKELTITKSEGNRVYEINNIKTIEIYKHYLGQEVVDNILIHGTQFPLIYNDNGIDVARAPIILHEDGSLTFAGMISQESKVRFGYANVEFINQYNQENLFDEFFHKNEAIYIFSCTARRAMLGTYLNDEISLINEIAPTSGFITYGEFFHDSKSCSNNLLNITTTYVILNEEESSEKIQKNNTYTTTENRDITLKALTTLVSRTSEELDENIYYLEQFKRAIDEASIFSVTDEKGIIKDANKNFEIISGYDRKELIGKPHNIVRHKDTDSSIFKDMWKTIQNGQIWKGLVKNRRKDGTPYYVLSEISPIYNKDGSFREYIGIRNDVTALEEYKLILKNELDTTNKSFEESLNYVRQYEDAMSTTIAIIKTDSNNIITYVNERFCELSKYSVDELIGRNCQELRHQKHRENEDCVRIIEKVKNKIIVRETLTNLTKDQKEFIVKNLFYPILDIHGELVEILQIMYDITEIVQLNEEIVHTQKEVILTMGAIGETRSKETGQHVKRVAEYSYLLARLAGLNEEEASLLKQASPMHDIGKVGIPDSVLNKPGKLTFEEFEVMKTHADIGYEMLKHSDRTILKASALIAHTHHEKWDGTGYPNALSGENIPIFGRITAIADVFDALGHDRVYKKAWPLNEILDLFKEQSGKHFDPNLINLFFTHLNEFLEIREYYESDV